MKVYVVGGAVRDKLLGRIPRDYDYIVTETSEDELLKAGFTRVGKRHHVYLHPETNDEYSLCLDVKEDLLRRDLTINALLQDGAKIIDLFGGLKDLEEKTLRHIRRENFFSDPLRIFRVARFVAQFPDFRLHKETASLMREVSRSQEFKTIDPERIFIELKKALLSKNAELFFKVLKETDCLSVHMPEIENASLEPFKKLNSPLMRYVSLFMKSEQQDARKMSERIRTPVLWRDSAMAVALFYKLKIETASDLVDYFYRVDAFRKKTIVGALFEILKTLENDNSIELSYNLIEKYDGPIPSHLEGRGISEFIRQQRVEMLVQSNFRDKVP